MEVLLGATFVAALAIAFPAQLLLSPRRRTRIIFAAAGAPTLVLLLPAIPFAPWDQSWFHALVSLAFALSALFIAGLFGAVAGSELASLTNWLLHRRG